MVRLIISFNRHESEELAQEAVGIALDRQADGIVGIDLAGNEAEFSAAPFAGLFEEARQEGLKVTIHAGEWGGAENVRQAIEDLGADRIGHGIRVLEDPDVVALARERGTPFEVCVTSNHHSGVVDSLPDHPITQMIHSGLNVTINTDDPSISKINLSSEYQAVHKDLGLSMDMIGTRVKAAAQAAFLPAGLREKLSGAIETEFMRKLILPD